MPLAFTGTSLGEILETTATPYSLPSGNIRSLTDVQTVDIYKMFTVVLQGGLDLDMAGVSFGDRVEYNTTAGRKQGTISAITGDTFTVRFAAELSQAPTSTPAITVLRGGSLTRMLRGAGRHSRARAAGKYHAKFANVY